MGDILDISDLTVRYPDGRVAVHDVSFRVAPHERVGLIGPNGAGKTSLMLAIMGGLKSAGQIVIDGVALSRRTATEARSRCGMTFQNPDDQLFMPTLLDDVAFGPLNEGLAPDAAAGRSHQAVEAVGLAGFEQRPAHHLSGGEKRRAALATILSMHVKLLLLDEPGEGLDRRGLRRLIELLDGRDEAMLLATHDLDTVRRLCRRVIVLDDGHLVADGAVEEVLSDTDLLDRHGLR